MRARFGLWAVAMLALGALFVLRVSPDMRVETDILAMLPGVERDAAAERAAQALADTAGRRLLFLVGAAQADGARQAATRFADALQDSGAFAGVQLAPEFDATALDALYRPHRFGLLSDRQRALLQAGGADALVAEALRALYTPAGWVRVRPFAEDPLNLYGDFLMQLVPAGGRLRFDQGLLMLTAPDGAEYVSVTAELHGSPFSIAEQRRAEPALLAALAQAGPAARVLTSGVLRHAAANSERAKREITTFGSVSLVAVVLLVLTTFRGLRPLVLTLGSVGVGAMAALTACHFMFEKIHIVTLVFGSTLIGVAVDYSLHYFSDQFRFREAWPATDTLRHVGPAILIGMLATALGYQAFLLPPFPGIRQMAVFSITGVAAACACVLLAYPLLANRTPARHEPRMLRLARWLEALPLGRPPGRAGRALLLAATALVGLGLWRLEFVDDVRALPSAPPALQEEERQVRELLGHAPDTRFLLVRADSPEAVLQAEERLREGLDALVQRGALGGYQAVSRALPSAQRQRQAHALLGAHVYQADPADGALARILREAGYPPGAVRQALAGFPAEPELLTPDAWRTSPAAAGLGTLWLGDTGTGYATAVTLAGLADLAALRALDASLPDVTLVDRVAGISEVLQRYRRIAGGCLAGAYLLIGLVLALRYGPRAGAWLLAAPVGAAALTLAVLGLAGVSANLFNVLALLLVLGMGVDYSVFMREAGTGSRATVIMAILLAGLMTQLAFGMLAVSATPFIRSIGLTVLLGVTFTFMLALVCAPRAAGK